MKTEQQYFEDAKAFAKTVKPMTLDHVSDMDNPFYSARLAGETWLVMWNLTDKLSIHPDGDVELFDRHWNYKII